MAGMDWNSELYDLAGNQVFESLPENRRFTISAHKTYVDIFGKDIPHITLSNGSLYIDGVWLAARRSEDSGRSAIYYAFWYWNEGEKEWINPPHCYVGIGYYGYIGDTPTNLTQSEIEVLLFYLKAWLNGAMDVSIPKDFAKFTKVLNIE